MPQSFLLLQLKFYPGSFFAFSLLSVLLLTSHAACTKDKLADPEQVDYSFFVAGHTYGTPGTTTKGLYPPFVERFELINEDEHMAFGFLTGDVVTGASEENWDAAQSDLSMLKVNSFIAAGNHDYERWPDPLGGRQLFLDRFGSSYYSFQHQGDLFIVLDPNLDEWNISGDQLAFLRGVLNQQGPVARNIFVFFHQLLWWAEDNIYRKVRLNSLANRAQEINFWTVLYPLFKNSGKPVFMFAGDVGANAVGDEFFFHRRDQIRLVASGMGSIYRDNFIIVEVMATGVVRFRLIALSCGDLLDCLGPLEDYRVPE